MSGYSALLQSLNGNSDPHLKAFSKHLNLSGGDVNWHMIDKHGGKGMGGSLPPTMLAPERKRSRNIGSKSKRLLIDNQDALELKLTWEEIQERPAPPLPDFYQSEETVAEVAAFIRNHINVLLSISQDIALGKDTRMFIKVAAYLFLISVIGCLTDFLTLCYTSLFIVLTVPALYERYEDLIDRYVLMGYRKLKQLYRTLDEEYICKVHNWILEKQKFS